MWRHKIKTPLKERQNKNIQRHEIKIPLKERPETRPLLLMIQCAQQSYQYKRKLIKNTLQLVNLFVLFSQNKNHNSGILFSQGKNMLLVSFIETKKTTFFTKFCVSYQHNLFNIILKNHESNIPPSKYTQNNNKYSSLT